MRVIMSGDSKVGKTTIGKKIAERYGLDFYPSFSTGREGDQELILAGALISLCETRDKDIVVDRSVFDVYAYEMTYLETGRLKALVNSVANQFRGSLFVVLGDERGRDAYARFLMESLSENGLDFVFTRKESVKTLMEILDLWLLGQCL